MAAESFPPCVAAQVNYLLLHSPLALKVERAWSGYHRGLLDRFTLLVPYCLDYIRWDVIYNAQCPLNAPDIIFAAEDARFRPFKVGSEREAKNTIRYWNHKNPSQLLSLIHELREEYAAYQRKCVAELDDSRVKFEMDTILSREGIEMYLSSGFEKPEEVKFSVPLLDMDINKMVIGCPWKQQQKIFLQVIFPLGRRSSSASPAPHLKLVPSYELKELLSVEDFKLPPWLDGMCMAEYVPHLDEILEGLILDAVSSIDVRRRFLEALATVFGMPLEADLIFCRKANFIAASGAFTFLVQFFIPIQFPKQQPVLILRSSQHWNAIGEGIRSAAITNYPWSPRWQPRRMADKIYDFLLDECLKFKKQCIERRS